jgi:hypothetical protein
LESGSDAAGEVGAQRKLSPLGALLAALHETKIKFQVVGMTAAILQGAPCVTLDADLWVDVPERQYMKLINLSLRLGATMIRQTVVALTDGSRDASAAALHRGEPQTIKRPALTHFAEIWSPLPALSAR